MRRSLVFPAMLAGLTSSTAPLQSAFADAVDFQIVQQDVSVDRAAGSATFSVTFNRTPNFVAIDHGQPDAFQYEIDTDTTNLQRPIRLNEVDAVVRGGEIWEGRGIPVREPTGNGGAEAGGWGDIRALLPFELDGNTVTFTAPLANLGAADGNFRYRAFSVENGGVTAQVTGAVIPLPAAVLPGLFMLGGLGVARKLRMVQRI